jgi:hypothetical protein
LRTLPRLRPQIIAAHRSPFAVEGEHEQVACPHGHSVARGEEIVEVLRGPSGHLLHLTLPDRLARPRSQRRDGLVERPLRGMLRRQTPGFLLVRACMQNDIKMECLPGATAFVPALVVSGLPCDRFYFEGFLPHKKGRKTRLEYLCELPNTFILYESPHRLLKCLKQLAELCGAERLACVCRELTKLHEEVKTDTLENLISHFSAKKIKGEIVIVVSGK